MTAPRLRALPPIDRGIVPGVERIAVLRASALGDFIFALPALDALRAAYPSAEIVLLARDWHRDFLAGRRSPVDRVIPLSRGSFPGDSPTPAGGRRAFATIAAEGFDLALQLHGGGRHSNPVVAGLGARVTAGSRSPDAAPLDRTIAYEFFQHEVLRGLEVVSLVGATPVGLLPILASRPADRAEARAQLDDLVDLEGPAPIAVLHPGASDERRQWPPERFAAVGDRLADAGAVVAVTGMAAEADVVRGVAGRMTKPAADLAGRLNLGALAGLLERASVVVSNDTGPLHLAAALGRPTVGIFWCGNVISAGPLARDANRVAIGWRLECPVCGVDCMKGVCAHRASFVADVRVDEVADPALELLHA